MTEWNLTKAACLALNMSRQALKQVLGKQAEWSEVEIKKVEPDDVDPGNNSKEVQERSEVYLVFLLTGKAGSDNVSIFCVLGQEKDKGLPIRWTPQGVKISSITGLKLHEASYYFFPLMCYFNWMRLSRETRADIQETRKDVFLGWGWPFHQLANR